MVRSYGSQKSIGGDRMLNIKVKKEGKILVIGEKTELIVNLENQINFIKMNDELLPYKKKICLSNDLLSGKRRNVWETAIQYYYRQACAVAEGILVAREYRSRANVSEMEIR